MRPVVRNVWRGRRLCTALWFSGGSPRKIGACCGFAIPADRSACLLEVFAKIAVAPYQCNAFGGSMKTAMLALLLLAIATPAAFAQGAPPQGSPDKPYIMEYYYKTAWDIKRVPRSLPQNHFPLLRKSKRVRPHRLPQNQTPATHDRRFPLGLSRHHRLQKLTSSHHRQSR